MTTRDALLKDLVAQGPVLTDDSPALARLRATAVPADLPGGKLEAFKYTSVESLYDPALLVPVTTHELSVPPLAVDEACVLPVSGAPTDALNLPNGVTVTPLSQIDPDQIAIGLDIERYPLIHLNTSLLREGLWIRIAAGQQVSMPLLLDMSGSDDGACSRVIVEMGAGSSVQLMEQHPPVTANRVLDLRLGEGARLQQVRWQGRSTASAWQLTSATLAADAHYALQAYSLGGRPHRNDFHVRLLGDGASFELDGVQMARADERLDQQVVVEHIGLRGRSRQRINGVALDTSRLSFNGRIHIHPGAQQTDARLTNRNLQVDPGAQVNTKPELEIYADDVQCAHGATVGQLDGDQLFYLSSRGIPDATARELLMHGFLSECVPAGPYADSVGDLLAAALTGAQPDE